MKTSRKYVVVVVLLAVLAVMFGVFGTVAPPLAEEAEPQQTYGSSSDSVGHFQNPPTYNSGWMNITTRAGQYVTLKHGLNTTDVVVDITGKQSLDPVGGALDWSRTYGGADYDWAYSVVQTLDRGYALAGYTDSLGAGLYDFWLVKTDSAGNHLWNQTYGGANNDYAISLVQTSDGGYAIAGYTYSYGAGNCDFWLVKTDSAGNAQWNQTYGGTNADSASASVVQTSDGGYVIAGSTQSFGAGLYDFWLVKTDSNGNHLWNKTYGGASGDVAYSLVQTSDGGYAIAGYTNSYGAGYEDFWLVKTDSAGNATWNQTYGGTGWDVAYSGGQTSDGGYALAGYTRPFGTINCDFWLVKTDAAGNHLWNKTYGGALSDYAYSGVQTLDGGYAIVGYTYSFAVGGSDFWLVKTDSAGNAQWNQTYGGANNDFAYSLVQTSDGGYAIAGYTNSYGAGGHDFWLIEVKPEMNFEHQRNLGGDVYIEEDFSTTYGGLNHDYFYSMVQTRDGGYALAGTSSGDFWLVKTDSAGNVQWNQMYDGAGDDWAYSIVQTRDGGYALAGYTKPFATDDDDFWLVKTDAAGNHLWNQTYGGTSRDFSHSVVQTSDGGYALVGTTNSSSGAGRLDFWLVKTDRSGNMEWNKTYGGIYTERAYSVVQTSDGGYAIAGETDSFGTGGMPNFYLVKVNSTGIMEWDRVYDGPASGSDYAHAVIQTADGGYAVAGDASRLGAYFEIWLVKTDASGNAVWNQTYGGTGDAGAYSVVETSDGYALAGFERKGPGGDADFWLVKTDRSGNMEWSETYGGDMSDHAYSVVQTSEKQYAVAGYGYSNGAEHADGWLILTKVRIETGVTMVNLANDAVILYRGRNDVDWNYVRVRIWLIEEPSWIYGDINMDGVIDAQDLYILGRNYGKTFSLLSLGGMAAVAGVHTYKKRKQQDS